MSGGCGGKYARTGTGIVQVGKLDEVISLLRDTNYPAFASQQGFKGAMLLTQSATGKSVSITLWETEVGATGQAAATNPARAGLLYGRSVREIFEVSVQV